MAKTIYAKGKYAVSFNCCFGDFCCGEDRAFTLDNAGDDINALAAEVIAGDPNYPMVFVCNTDPDSIVIGHFHHVNEDPECCDAVMVPYEYL